MVDKYQLDKWLWTHSDFADMGWHDSIIYGLKIDLDIYFDIDYIFKWVEPDQDLWFSFWIAPCTLVFESPTKVQFNLENTGPDNQLEIADLYQEINKDDNTEWRIETNMGDVLIEAKRFKQIVRRQPTLQAGQQIIPEERGEVSFSVTHEKAFIETDQVKLIKEKQFLLQMKATEVKHLQIELANLFDKRIRNEIDVKQYILSKRHIEQQIEKFRQDLNSDNVEV